MFRFVRTKHRFRRAILPLAGDDRCGLRIADDRRPVSSRTSATLTVLGSVRCYRGRVRNSWPHPRSFACFFSLNFLPLSQGRRHTRPRARATNLETCCPLASLNLYTKGSMTERCRRVYVHVENVLRAVTTRRACF